MKVIKVLRHRRGKGYGVATLKRTKKPSVGNYHPGIKEMSSKESNSTSKRKLVKP
ncbi:hypothetical protein [Alteribacillus bidgolensis]|uniref:Uncharacterized protein n=1 Tax=Alteribacillus bidgolensis TaxID=930129 RepID=A0A1G8FWV6_9BACI|nr:hypothetical protein [Alteribacillus bidgolensis]SDH86601.1 hypothetical protein SAMN05216352_103123 [Alteribacillus bidgolensis]